MYRCICLLIVTWVSVLCNTMSQHWGKSDYRQSKSRKRNKYHTRKIDITKDKTVITLSVIQLTDAIIFFLEAKHSFDAD